MTERERLDALVEMALKEFPVEVLLLKEDFRSLYKKGLITCFRGESGEFYWKTTEEGKRALEMVMCDVTVED